MPGFVTTFAKEPRHLNNYTSRFRGKDYLKSVEVYLQADNSSAVGTRRLAQIGVLRFPFQQNEFNGNQKKQRHESGESDFCPRVF